MQREQRLAFQSIRQYPAWFAWRTVRRIVYLWTGYWSFDRGYMAKEPMDLPNIPVCTAMTVFGLLGLRELFRRDRGLGTLFGMAIFIFPLIYYVTSPETYYRRPIDTFLVLMGASYLAIRTGRRVRLLPSFACAPARVAATSARPNSHHNSGPDSI
jgi:hypothetical protein